MNANLDSTTTKMLETLDARWAVGAATKNRNVVSAKLAALASAGAAVALTAAISFGAPTAAMADEAPDAADPNANLQEQEAENGTTTETKTVDASVLDENATGEITVTETTTEMDPVVDVDEQKNADGSITKTTTTTTVTEDELSVDGQVTTEAQGEVDVDVIPAEIADLNVGDKYGDYTVIDVREADGSTTYEMSKPFSSDSGAIDAAELQKILGEGYTVEAGEGGSFIINGKEYIVSENVDEAKTVRTLTISIKQESHSVSTEEKATEDAKAAAKEQAIAAFEEAQGAKIDRETMTYTDAAGHTYVVTVEVNEPTKSEGSIDAPDGAFDVVAYKITATAQIAGAVSTWSETAKSSTLFVTDKGTISAVIGEKFPGTTGTVIDIKKDADGNVIQVVTSEESKARSSVSVTTVITYNFTYGAPTAEEIADLQGEYEGINADSLKKVSWTANKVVTTVSTEKISVKDQATVYDDGIKSKIDDVAGTYKTHSEAVAAIEQAIAGTDATITWNADHTKATITSTINVKGLSVDELAKLLGAGYSVKDGKLMKGDAVVTLDGATVTVVTTADVSAKAGAQVELKTSDGKTMYFASEEAAQEYVAAMIASGEWASGSISKDIVKEETIVIDKVLKTISASSDSLDNARALLVQEIKKAKNALTTDQKITINDVNGKQVAVIDNTWTDKQIEDMVAAWTVGKEIKESVDTKDLTPEQIESMLESLRKSETTKVPNASKFVYNHVDVDKNGTMTVDGKKANYEFSKGSIVIDKSAANIANGIGSFHYTYPSTATPDGSRTEYYMEDQPHEYSSHKPGINVSDSYYMIVGEFKYWFGNDKSNYKTIAFTTYGYLGMDSNVCGARPSAYSSPSQYYYGYDLRLGNIEVKDGKITVLTHGVFTTSIAVEKEVPAWKINYCHKDYEVKANDPASTITASGQATTTNEVKSSDDGSEVVGEYELTDKITVTGKERSTGETKYIYTGEDSQDYGSYKTWEMADDATASDTTARDLSMKAKNTQTKVDKTTVTIHPEKPKDPDPAPTPAPTPDPKDPEDAPGKNLPQTGDSLPMGVAGGSAALAALLMALGFRRRHNSEDA